MKKIINTLLVTCVMIMKFNHYMQCFQKERISYDGQTKWMHFSIKDDDLLEKYNAIWDKASADIKKEFDSEPVYNKRFLKTKIKAYGDEITDFFDKDIPKVDYNHTCLAVISLDFALKKDETIIRKYFQKSINTLKKS